MTRLAKGQNNPAVVKNCVLHHAVVGAKALLCSSIKSVVQVDFELQGLIVREAICGFVGIPTAIKITHI